MKVKIDRALDIAINMLDNYYGDNENDPEDEISLMELSKAIFALMELQKKLAELSPLIVGSDSRTSL
jgi:hypothetical protein